jgi:hypothetical protein
MRLPLLFATILLAGHVSGVIARSQSRERATIPAGTRILVRTTDNISSEASRPGQRFTGTLETNVELDGVIVAPRGATVHGRLAEASAAGRTTGRSRLTLELTDLIIDGTANPILTDTYQIRGRGQSGRTTRRGLRGAGLGALVGSAAGGGGGAAVGGLLGAGAGKATAVGPGGQQISLPGGSLIEFRLAQPASLQVSR